MSDANASSSETPSPPTTPASAPAPSAPAPTAPAPTAPDELPRASAAPGSIQLGLDRKTLAAERNANRNGIIRIASLVVVAIVMLANATGWVDPDLWLPFVCIIATMGIGTRGGPLESRTFVYIEAAVVLLLGIATFSGSRDFVWAASLGVCIVAIGKVAYLEVARREQAASEQASSGPTSSDARK